MTWIKFTFAFAEFISVVSLSNQDMRVVTSISLGEPIKTIPGPQRVQSIAYFVLWGLPWTFNGGCFREVHSMIPSRCVMTDDRVVREHLDSYGRRKCNSSRVLIRAQIVIDFIKRAYYDPEQSLEGRRGSGISPRRGTCQPPRPLPSPSSSPP